MRAQLTSVVIISATTLLVAGCASTASKPAAAPVAVAAPAAAANPSVPARTALQISMNELLDEPKKLAVFTKHAPALATNSQITMARGMSLADVAGYEQAGLTPDLVKAIVDDINKL